MSKGDTEAHAAFENGEWADILEQFTTGALHPLLVRAAVRMADDRALGWARTLDDPLALAEALLSAGHLDEGRALIYGPQSGPLARVAAQLSIAAGRAEEALPQVVSALPDLQGYERALGLGTAASALHFSRHYEAAVERWEEALALRIIHETHPERASLWDGLASSMRRMGRAEGGLALHDQALALHIATYGTHHPALAGSLHGRAQCLQRLGRYPEARDDLQQALTLSEHIQGADHTDTRVTAFELGRLEVDCGEVRQGFERMSAAFEQLRAQLGPQHPTVQAMAQWL